MLVINNKNYDHSNYNIKYSNSNNNNNNKNYANLSKYTITSLLYKDKCIMHTRSKLIA